MGKGGFLLVSLQNRPKRSAFFDGRRRKREDAFDGPRQAEGKGPPKDDPRAVVESRGLRASFFGSLHEPNKGLGRVEGFTWLRFGYVGYFVFGTLRPLGTSLPLN